MSVFLENEFPVFIRFLEGSQKDLNRSEPLLTRGDLH